MIVYISIGNSDDKLSQEHWSYFLKDVNERVRLEGHVHGYWHSGPDQPWQNACWCVEIYLDGDIERLRFELSGLAAVYKQDSIAWAEVKGTEFIQPLKTEG